MASTNFINECKNRANANRLGKIIIDGITSPITNSDNLQSFEIDSGCYTDGNIIGSVYAKCLKANFIAEQNNLTDKPIQAQIGVKYTDLSNEYINMGKYKVERPNNEITANMSQITAYSDLYTNLDSKYICNIDYSTGDKTLSDLYVDVCNQLGLTPVTTTFINSTIPITANPFTNGEKNRTVLQTIAKISCSFIDIDNDTNKIDLCWLSSSKTPDYTFYKNDYSSVEGGQVVCGPINCLIIKNSQVDDENVTIKDDESIKKNGENSIIISEDYILYNSDLRQQAITDIWNRVKGMKYVDCKLTTYYGKPFLKLGDYIRIYTSETEYFDTYVLKHNFTYDGSFTSIIESPALTEQEIKTKQNISLGEALRNTQIIVDKQLGKITSIVDEMNTKVEDITTTTQTSTGGNSLYLKEALESNALEYSIDGKCEQSTSTQGKNYYTGNKLTNGTNHGITYTFDNSILKLNGTSSDSGSIVSDVNTKINIPAGTYAYSMRKKSGSFTQNNKDLAIYLRSATGFITGDGTSSGLTLNSISSSGSVKKIITVSKDTELYIRIFVNGSGLVCDNLELEIQIEPGSSMTDFEQFVPNSPSPDYPSEIETVKGIRNLFNGVLFNGYLNNGLVADSKWKTTDYIEVKSNTKYITSYLKNTTRVLYEEYTSKDVSSRISARKETTPKTVITTQNTTKYIRFSFNDNSLTDKEIMLEKGLVTHSYVPYGTYEKIKVTGKNIVDYEESTTTWNGANIKTSKNAITYTPNTNNEASMSHSSKHKQIFIPAGTTITWSQYYVSGSQWMSGTLTNILRLVHKDGTYETCSFGDFNISNYQKIHYKTYRIENDVVEIYSYCMMYGVKGMTTPMVYDYQLEIGTSATDYEPYKEKEVLIDLAKENLFDKDNANIFNGYVSANLQKIVMENESGIKSLFIEIEPNTTYSIYKILSEQFAVCTSQAVTNNQTVSNAIVINSWTNFTIKSNANDKYLVVGYYKSNSDTLTEQEILNSIKIYKSTNADDSYELNSIGDIKDKLEIINGVVDIQKRIGKIVLNGSENWFKASDTSINNYGVANIINATKNYDIGLSSHFVNINKYPNVLNTFAIRNNGTSLMFNSSITTLADFKSWLQSNPVTVYYVLKTPETITLPNTNIPLYEGVNHVTLVEDLETTTSIKYLRKTPISGEYALNQDLNKTNSNLADTNNQLSQTQSDIDNTKTNLNNNYYNKEQVDSINSTTTQNITQIRNTMEQNITSTNASISKIQEEITNGVSKVTTTTGTFDENGLNISKSGQQMSSTLDWDGLEVVRDKRKATETEVLTVRSAGVEAENMTVRNFFIKKPIRIEKCKSITDSTKVGLGFFWIGE